MNGSKSTPESKSKIEKSFNSKLTGLFEGASNLEEAFSLMLRWSQSEKVSELEAGELEEQFVTVGFELLRMTFEESLNSRDYGCVGDFIEEFQEDGTKEQLTHKRVHQKQYESIFGTVKIQRMGYKSRGGKSIHPLDEKLNLPKQKYSFLLQKRAAKLCGRGPFDEAVENIRETTVANFPKRQISELMVEASQNFEMFYEERREKMHPPEETGPLMIIGVDCKGVRNRRTQAEKRAQSGKRLAKGEKKSKKKMATVATVHTTQPHFRTAEEVVSRLMDQNPVEEKKKKPKAEERRLWASLHKRKEEVFDEIVEEVKNRVPNGEKTVVLLTDGERALKSRAEERLKPEFPNMWMVLDIIHVIEYLWKAAYLFCEEGSKEAFQWVRKRLLQVLKGKVRSVVQGIRNLMTRRKLSLKKAKLGKTICGYFSGNQKRMKYHLYLMHGFPIASGSVEGACGHLVKDRMERSGASWNVKGDVAEAVLKIRAIEKSGDFEEYWKFHVQQEKFNNYQRMWGAV